MHAEQNKSGANTVRYQYLMVHFSVTIHLILSEWLNATNSIEQMPRMHLKSNLLMCVCHTVSLWFTQCCKFKPCTDFRHYHSVYVCVGMCVGVCVHTQKQSSNTGLVGNHTLLYSFLCVCVCVCVCVCMSLLPIHRPFCVGVCQRCCLQAGPHCVEPLLLIDTGPLALRVPMAPQPRRTEGWNRSPGPGESLFALPFHSPGAPGALAHGDGAKRMAAQRRCVCWLWQGEVQGGLFMCVCARACVCVCARVCVCVRACETL